MPVKPRITVLFAIALAVAGCASDTDSNKPTPAAAVVGTTDGSKSQTINVDLADFSFTPSTLTFRSGQAYQLHIVNKSTHAHTFSSDTFFKAITIQKLVKNGANIGTSDLDEDIDLAAGETVDLYFVAGKPGAYDLYCSKFMHEMLGMDGKITVM